MGMNNRGNNKPLNRRHFLKLSTSSLGVLAAFPMEAFLNTIVTGLLKNANAADLPPALNYVHFNAPGGPARWLFDLFLQPNGPSDPFIALPTLGNYVNADASVLYKTIQAPGSPYWINWQWQFPVPKSDGSTRPMTDLLEHMLSIRGVRLNADGHPNNVRLQIQPVLGGPSLTGIAADASGRTFSSISHGGAEAISAFKSPNGAANITLPTTSHPISYLFNPFQAPANSYRTNATIDGLVGAALENLSENAKANNLSTQFLGKDRKNAETIFRTNISNFIAQYDGLVIKYRDLINRAIRTTGLEGINQESISPILDDPRFKIAYGNVTLDKMRNPNLDNLFTTGTMEGFASGLAVTEFALMNRLSTSILCGINPISNLNVNGLKVAMRHDAHDCGSVPIALIHGMWARSVATCLIELIDQLKSLPAEAAQPPGSGPTIFDNTVIHFCGEMGRFPGVGDSGHGWESQNVSIWSGQVENFTVLGNITTKNISYFGRESPGTWGCAAPVPELGNSLVGINNVTTTIATMLGVTPPSRIGPSLVAVQTNGAGKKTIVPVISGPKNIPN